MDKKEYNKERSKQLYESMLKARLYPLAEKIKGWDTAGLSTEKLAELLYNEKVRIKNK